jgi:AraC-like DNA-binding protein
MGQVNPDEGHLTSPSLRRDLHIEGADYYRVQLSKDEPRKLEVGNFSYCVIVTQGKMTLEVDFPENQKIFLKEGDLVSISGLSNHSFISEGVSKIDPLSFEAQPMKSELGDGDNAIIGFIPNEALALASWLMGPIMILRDQHQMLSQRIWNAIHMLEDEYDQELADNDLVVRRLTEIILINFARRRQEERGWPQSPPVLKAEGKVIAALGTYLNTPEQRWDLNKLAKAAGMSRTRFIEEFKALTGWTPGRLISRLRFAEARRRMLIENLSVEAAAEIAGYSSAAAFVRAFQRQYGETPARWRRNNSRRPHEMVLKGESLFTAAHPQGSTDYWE